MEEVIFHFVLWFCAGYGLVSITLCVAAWVAKEVARDVAREVRANGGKPAPQDQRAEHENLPPAMKGGPHSETR